MYKVSKWCNIFIDICEYLNMCQLSRLRQHFKLGDTEYFFTAYKIVDIMLACSVYSHTFKIPITTNNLMHPHIVHGNGIYIKECMHMLNIADIICYLYHNSCMECLKWSLSPPTCLCKT